MAGSSAPSFPWTLPPRFLARCTRALVFLAAWILSGLFSPLPLQAQRTYFGAVGGMTATRLPGDIHHYGALAGLFFQGELSDHVGIRSEASWVQTGAGEYSPLSSGTGAESVVTRDLEYFEVNALGRLSWASGALPPLGSKIGMAVMGGGWLGAHARGAISGSEPRSFDFGHLLGVGFFWKLDPVLVEVDLRSGPGEVRYWKQGPKRKTSQLVFSLGYRIPSPSKGTSSRTPGLPLDGS